MVMNDLLLSSLKTKVEQDVMTCGNQPISKIDNAVVSSIENGRGLQ